MATPDSKEMLGLIRQSLRRVDFGEDILTYIEKLIDERDQLLKRQEHLRSLTMLFEKTVSDADDMATQIKKEAQEAAAADAANIVAQAEEQAQKITEETRARALSDAREEAEAIKASARLELEALLEEQRGTIKVQIEEVGERMYRQMLEEAEESRQRVGLILKKLEKGSDSTNIIDASDIALNIHDAEATEEQPGALLESETGTDHEPYDEELQAAGSIEIEILPPRDKDAIDNIKSYLAQLIEVTDAQIEHLTDKTLIQVHLSEPVDLAESLSDLPEIGEVHEIAIEGRQKIEVVLAVSSEMEKERERLNFRANRIASKIHAKEKLTRR